MTIAQLKANALAAWAYAKREATFAITWLNTLGGVLLAYALQNPDITSQVPFAIPGPAKVIIPVAWWLLVQLAKARDLKKAAA